MSGISGKARPDTREGDDKRGVALFVGTGGNIVRTLKTHNKFGANNDPSK